MNLSFKNQANFKLVFVISILLVLSCDAWVTVKGKVVDETGNPVKAAKITIEQGKSKVVEKLSEKDGSFDINENICPMPGCSPDIKLTVTKEGYQIYEKMLSEEDLKRRRIDIKIIKN